MQMQMPAMSRLNKGIVIAFVSTFLLSAICKQAGFSLAHYIGLSGSGILSGKIWSLFTYALLPHNILECLFDGLIFWFIGSELENMWGPRRYAYFLLSCILGGALIFLMLSFLFFSQATLFSFPLTGPAGLASAMCVAYGVIFPQRTMYFFFFPMQAKWFVILLVCMNLYHGFFSPSGVFAWAQIGAMASGFVWMLMVSNPQLKEIFQKSATSVPGKMRKKKKNKISHLHIVEDEGETSDDDSTPPTYH